MKKENRKMAQERRAKERRAQERMRYMRILVPVLLAAVVAACVICGFVFSRKNERNAGSGQTGSTSEDTKRKEASDVTTEDTAGAAADAAGSSSGSKASSAGQITEFDASAVRGCYDISGDDLTYVQINVKDYGTITAALDKTIAPISVENFVSLAEQGFYDGLTFHRIIDGFMIQGGDPNGNGTGGSEKTIRGEFSGNQVDNPITHVRGAVSMARSQDPDSASSQFFIVQSDSNYLDGQYAGFGYVTDGMDIVDQICKDARPTDGNGSIAPENQPVIESVVVLP